MDIRYYMSLNEDGDISYFYYVGETRDIKALYKSIMRAYNNYKTCIGCNWITPPRFSEWKRCYALCICIYPPEGQESSQGHIWIDNSDYILNGILTGEIIPAKPQERNKSLSFPDLPDVRRKPSGITVCDE